MDFLNGMFGKIAPDMCKLTMNGDIAVKTNNGYKSYDIKTGILTNCENFVFGMGGMDMFFLIPTNKVKVGDIIIANGKPKCVVKVEKNGITCINYETSVVETILPEHNVFMGNTYLYGKIVSIFGNVKKKGGSSKIMQYMMMSEMMKSNNSNNSNGLGAMLPFMMLSGKNNMFEDMFDFAEDDTEEEEE